MKRMSIRLVPELAESIQKISKKRGISVNALITEMAWSFVESMKKEPCGDKTLQEKSTGSEERGKNR